MSHRSHPYLGVWRLPCIMPCDVPNQRASGGFTLCGLGHIEHKMALVKNLRALFHSAFGACTVVPLQVAQAEVQGTDCPMLSAKIARPVFDAQPCSHGCNRHADDFPQRRQSAKTLQPSWCASRTTVSTSGVCRSASCHPRC